MFVTRPKITVKYDNVDITADISDSLVSLTYKDKITGETDDLDIAVEDADEKWQNDWYPKKGSKVSVSIGYDDNLVECGTFQVDESELSGPPDVVNIRAIAAYVTKAMRTRNTKSNEAITLKQLAQDICKKHELKLDDGSTIHVKRPDTKREQAALKVLAKFAYDLGFQSDNATRYLSISALQRNTYPIIKSLLDKGYTEEAKLLQADCQLVAANMTKNNCLKFSIFCSEIETRLIKTKLEFDKTTSIGLEKITLEKKTQYQETDLYFLARIAAEYGFAFSIKGSVMVFYIMKSIESSPARTAVFKDKLNGLGNIKNYSFKDKTSETYKKASVKSHNPKKKELITVDVEAQEQKAEDGSSYRETTSDDTIEIKTRAENKQQAEAKANAALHKHNSRVQTCSITVIGDPLLVAGNNVDIIGFGKYSGKWHITESTHTINKSNGYTTDFEAKRVARFSSDGSATKGGGSKTKKKRGDTRHEEDLLGKLAAYALKISKEKDNALRYLEVSALLRNTYPVVKSLYDKNCDKEARELQSNCEMVAAYMSQSNCAKFSIFANKIRVELIKSRT